VTGQRCRKYLAFARTGFAAARAEPGEILARSLFLTVILGVFSSLWRAVAESGMPLAARPDALVWYLALTEWVLLSAPQVHFEIAAQVRRGDVAYALSRPVSYLGAEFAEAVGALVFRAPLLLAAAFGAAAFYTGGAPENPLRLLYALPFGLAAAVGFVALNVTLGLTAFWVGEIAPVHWIVQKLGFVLGGLMLPLELYPRLLARIAELTPFPSLLYGPASFLLDGGPHRAPRLALALAFWLCVFWLLSTVLLGAAVRRLSLNGG